VQTRVERWGSVPSGHVFAAADGDRNEQTVELVHEPLLDERPPLCQPPAGAGPSSIKYVTGRDASVGADRFDRVGADIGNFR
jgi:hypothetical protein